MWKEDRRPIFVCDDSAGVVEEVAYWVFDENFTMVHIKPNRKRRVEGTDCVCAKYFGMRSVFTSFAGFLANSVRQKQE